MRKLGREMQVFMADSGQQHVSNYNYLPGGVLTAIRGKAVALINPNVYRSKLGNFIIV